MEDSNVIDAAIMGRISASFSAIGVDCSPELLEQWALSCCASPREMDNLACLLVSLKSGIDTRRRAILSSLSRIPQVSRKTFDNFKLDRLSGNNIDVINHIKGLGFLSIGENVVLVGDPGTGKTHLAQAIGNLCVDNLIGARYFKMNELADKLRKSHERGKEMTFVDSLVNIPCLIIDEMGYCNKFSDAETNLFFQMLDRRYDRGKGTTVFTSNKMPSEWKDMFSDVVIARCTLDRIMDRCIAIEIKGSSYRGSEKKVFKLSCSNGPQITGISKSL